MRFLNKALGNNKFNLHPITTNLKFRKFIVFIPQLNFKHNTPVNNTNMLEELNPAARRTRQRGSQVRARFLHGNFQTQYDLHIDLVFGIVYHKFEYLHNDELRPPKIGLTYERRNEHTYPIYVDAISKGKKQKSNQQI